MTSRRIPRTTMHQPKQCVARFFPAEIDCDSLLTYVVAPPSAKWNLLSETSSTFNMTPCSCAHYSCPIDFKLSKACRLESTPRHDMLKRASLRHAPRISTAQKLEHHQHHALMSSSLISSVLFCSNRHPRR
jgi:hypothetical protein